ncbi:MAG: hypothetical protein BWY60_00070 [Actinobacteria bacterium ADurb.Bin346]|nr:MAG: hypothetical protein BWY60_00070 [Actinobacteria bacterium ADurb.Bin346]
MVSVPEIRPVSPIPTIRQRSETPTITSALTAVLNAPLFPIRIIANNVIIRPSQKNSIITRLSAITAPFVMAREIKTYAKNCPDLFLSFMKVVEYKVIRTHKTATARIMKLLKLSSLIERSIPNPVQGIDVLILFLNIVIT